MENIKINLQCFVKPVTGLWLTIRSNSGFLGP